jgi:hypothetical protein
MENVQFDVLEIVEVSETIKEIPGFSRYLCNIENGRIYRKPTETSKGKWLKQSPNDIGYCMTSLKDDNGKLVHGIYVHELVMSAAIEFPKSWWTTKNLEIDHRDRNKSNNNIGNLQLVTKVNNHKNIEGRKDKVRLSREDVKYIMSNFIEWEGRKIPFYKLMAEQFGCVWQTIQYTVLGYNNQSKLD